MGHFTHKIQDDLQKTRRRLLNPFHRIDLRFKIPLYSLDLVLSEIYRVTYLLNVNTYRLISYGYD